MQRRNHQLRIWLTLDERKLLESSAGQHSLTLAAYVRLVLSQYDKMCFDIKEIKNDTHLIKEVIRREVLP